MEPLGIFVVLALLAAGIGYYEWNRRRRRMQQISARAARHGWNYSHVDPFGMTGYPFALLAKGDGRGCENVFWGFWKGMPFRAADYWYYVESSDSEGGTNRTYKRFNVVIADTTLQLPHIQIDREGIVSRLADHLGFRDIDFESEAFNRMFQVKAQDRAFAFKLIDARVMHWLISIDARFSFELHGSNLMIYSKKLKPQELLPLIGTAREFLERVPRLIVTEYGPGRTSA